MACADYEYELCAEALRRAYSRVIDHQPRHVLVNGQKMANRYEMMALVALDPQISRKVRVWLSEPILREVCPNGLEEYYKDPSPSKEASASKGGGTPAMPERGGELEHIKSRFTRGYMRSISRDLSVSNSGDGGGGLRRSESIALEIDVGEERKVSARVCLHVCTCMCVFLLL